MYYAISYRGNAKTGAIPVTTSSKNTCPKSCSLIEKGCYAKAHHLGRYWTKLSTGESKNPLSFGQLCNQIKVMLPKDQLWRHNQAGDLPTQDQVNICAKSLDKLIKANRGKRGFTFTHYNVLDNPHNAKLIANANRQGFTINLSADNLREADKLLALNVAPVVTLLPIDSPKKSRTPDNNLVVTCPNAYKKAITCSRCQLCYKSNRDYIIGFPAHGTSKKQVDIIARG